MAEKVQSVGPYPFQQDDLAPERLLTGVDATLDHFYAWRAGNPRYIASHIDRHTEQLETVIQNCGLAARARRVLPAQRKAHKAERVRDEVAFFYVRDLAEIPGPDTVEAFRRTVVGTIPGGVGPDITRPLREYLPIIGTIPNIDWLNERVGHLRRILPESVIRNGGMGKTIKTIVGVLAVGAYDTLGESQAVVKEHLARIVPAAYAYGSLYPIIDDTLQDGKCIAETDRAKYTNTILHGLRTGEPMQLDTLPDHPLTDELVRAYNIFLDTFPFNEYPHLYKAGEAMFCAQERDSRKTAETAPALGLTAMYPDIFVKAAMTRVVANIIGRRTIPDSYYKRSINNNFVNQLQDDFRDRRSDQREHRLTPFTYPRADGDPNPLYDLFAYNAYVGSQLFNNDPRVTRILTLFNARRLALHLNSDPGNAANIRSMPGTTDEMARFIIATTYVPRTAKASLQRSDRATLKKIDAALSTRAPTDTDPRTFVSDRLDYMNRVIGAAVHTANPTRIDKIAQYSIEAGGKRLRPALSLMLAESLELSPNAVAPLLSAIELFHTMSLVYDDLPQQDGATLRRDRPTTHIAYDEAGAQLAGISMLSTGFGELAKLRQHFQADRVGTVIEYFKDVLSRLCNGQDIDLRMERSDVCPSTDQIIEMYQLKTSTAIEAALVPLMILTGQSKITVDLMRRYAAHAGVVFQLRDDILDATSNAAVLGKDTNNDLAKINIVRTMGREAADTELQHQLQAAVAACEALPFNTQLLQGIVTHFATRRK